MLHAQRLYFELVVLSQCIAALHNAQAVPRQCPDSARYSARYSAHWKNTMVWWCAHIKKYQIIYIYFFLQHTFTRTLRFSNGHCTGHCTGHCLGTVLGTDRALVVCGYLLLGFRFFLKARGGLQNLRQSFDRNLLGCAFLLEAANSWFGNRAQRVGAAPSDLLGLPPSNFLLEHVLDKASFSLVPLVKRANHCDEASRYLGLIIEVWPPRYRNASFENNRSSKKISFTVDWKWNRSDQFNESSTDAAPPPPDLQCWWVFRWPKIFLPTLKSGEGGCNVVVITMHVFDHFIYFTSKSFSFYGTHGHVFSPFNFVCPNIFWGAGACMQASGLHVTTCE